MFGWISGISDGTPCDFYIQIDLLPGSKASILVIWFSEESIRIVGAFKLSGP